jgi:hypothetical protein
LNQYPTTQADGTAKDDCKMTMIVQQREGIPSSISNSEKDLYFQNNFGHSDTTAQRFSSTVSTSHILLNDNSRRDGYAARVSSN